MQSLTLPLDLKAIVAVDAVDTRPHRLSGKVREGQETSRQVLHHGCIWLPSDDLSLMKGVSKVSWGMELSL